MMWLDTLIELSRSVHLGEVPITSFEAHTVPRGAHRRSDTSGRLEGD